MAAFDPGLKINQSITNDLLTSIFSCAPRGGMRKSNTFNCLILISSFRSIYLDRWKDNILYYTGEGQIGDQKLTKQNKTLYYSRETDITVYLFEVFEENTYKYRGEVNLIEDPFTENQLDSEGNNRDVWIFPLKLKTNEVLIDFEEIAERNKYLENRARKISDEELRKKIENLPEHITKRKSISTYYERNSDLAERVKRIAKGSCELCKNLAPFFKKNNEPYLEIHHIIWLSEGGADSLENTVALCPNCHRKMHSLNLKEDREALMKIALTHAY